MSSLLFAQTLHVTEFVPILAARLGRLLNGLSEGDPVAWSILVGVIVISIGISLWKKSRAED
jgi:hypothetical protein